MTGLHNDSWWRRIGELRPTLVTPLDEYTRRVDAIAQKLFPTDLIVADGAMEMIEAVHRSGVPFALVTNAERQWAMPRLEIMGITDAFNVTVTGEMVSAHKPDPEIYLKATQGAGGRPGGDAGHRGLAERNQGGARRGALHHRHPHTLDA